MWSFAAVSVTACRDNPSSRTSGRPTAVVVAAGLILVREAGGHVTELNGGTDMLETGSVLASNGQLHRELREMLAKSGAKA